MYLHKHQTYQLDIICLLKRTHKHAWGQAALKNPEEFQWILGSYGLSAVGLIPFLKQPPNTEKPCFQFIMANLKNGPSVMKRQRWQEGREEGSL